MATKTKAMQSGRHAKESSADGNRRENTVVEEAAINQIVEEVPGTIDDVSAGGIGSEFSDADKHRPVSSPERRPTESAVNVNGSEPLVDAGFAKFSSLKDEREFWDMLARAIGPKILTVARRSAAKRVETSQTESASSDLPDQREFWGAIAGALAPVVMPYAKKLALKAGKTGLSWLSRKFESSEQESAEDLDSMSRQLESLFVQQASSASKESANGSARDEREFWGFVAKNIIPALTPLAKAAAGASIRAGTKIVKGTIAKLPPQIISILRRDGYAESDIERMERAQQAESGNSMGEQREFWGAIAGAIVPALMPYAKKLAGAAVKSGAGWLRRRLESSQQESDQGMQSQWEEMFIEQVNTSSFESTGTLVADEREFWRTLARKIVPALAPIAKAATTAATRAGTSWIQKMIFESSQQESSENGANPLQPLEDLLVEEASAMRRESGSPASQENEREFWRSIVRKLSPVLAPIAKSVAGGALKAGKAVVSSGIRKLSARTANLLRVAGITEYAIQQLESGSQSAESAQPEVSEREFWRSIARIMVPIVKPIAHKLGKTAVSAGGKLVKIGSSMFESSRESANETEQIREAFVEQMEALEVIIGEDDRVQVTTTTSSPFNRICHLSIKAGDGSSFLGTGFFIGPRTVITAGHCVFDPDHGGWPQQIVVSPGRNGDDKPFGQFVATKFGSVEGWTETQDRDCDYGVIQLSEDDSAPSQIGSFGYGIFSDEFLSANQLHIAGYPGDQPSGTMMFHSRQAIEVSSTTVVYDIDTVGGQSGSPVYDENRRVVAIHTNGASSGNSATRINDPVFRNLCQWRSEGD